MALELAGCCCGEAAKVARRLGSCGCGQRGGEEEAGERRRHEAAAVSIGGHDDAQEGFPASVRFARQAAVARAPYLDRRRFGLGVVISWIKQGLFLVQTVWHARIWPAWTVG